jgi:hypothetical protein
MVDRVNPLYSIKNTTYTKQAGRSKVMTQNDGEKTVAEIKEKLQKINDAWLAGEPERMQHFLYNDMVILHSNFKDKIAGRQECIDGYRDFAEQATVENFQILDVQVDLFENTAVTLTKYEMMYELEGKKYHDRGHDLFVFSRINGEWMPVWRTIIPLKITEID